MQQLKQEEIIYSRQRLEKAREVIFVTKQAPIPSNETFDVRFRIDMKKVTGVIPGECQELVCVCVSMLVFVYVRQERGTEFRREEQMETERERNGEQERMKKKAKGNNQISFFELN